MNTDPLVDCDNCGTSHHVRRDLVTAWTRLHGPYCETLTRLAAELAEARAHWARTVELGQAATDRANAAEAKLARIHELHTDSVAGVCPSCGRIGDLSHLDDGLVDWPCPTVLVIDPDAEQR